MNFVKYLKDKYIFSFHWWGATLVGMLAFSLLILQDFWFVPLIDLIVAITLAYLLYHLREELVAKHRRLRETNARLDLANDMILVRDLSDRITYWNPACQRVYEWSAEEAIGQFIHTLLKTQAEQPLEKIQAQFLAKGEWKGELVHYTKTGKMIVVASTWSLHRDEKGKAIANLEINKDITEAKQVEAALRNRAEELAKTTDTLAKTTAILEKRNQELDQFAYIVSHDLKAPLRAIANLSSWIEEDLEEQLNEDTQQQMNLLRSRVHRLEALIDGLLQYSRIGRIKTDTQRVDVGTLLTEIIDSLAPPPEIKIILAPEMPILETEVLLLNQVLTNLISNGIKHRDRPQGEVKISARDLGEAWELIIEDDGYGINPAYHEKIFLMFQTLQPRDKVENTGVGLAIVKKIVEDQGGRIFLESREGQGSKFSFTWKK